VVIFAAIIARFSFSSAAGGTGPFSSGFFARVGISAIQPKVRTGICPLLQLRLFSFGFFQDGEMRIGAFPEREEILIQVAGFPQERVPLNTHSKFRRSFQTKGNLWCREGESNPQDPKVGGF
jgi:hypothetical protein